MQVVAGLLHDHFPNATIQADQVVGPNFLLSQHLQQAQTTGTAQYQTLSADSKDHWDAVIFQVRSLNTFYSHHYPARRPCHARQPFFNGMARL